MANNFVSILPNKHIVDIYYQLKKVTSKIQKTASSIGFLNQCVYYNVTPTFAKVRGSFPTIRDKQHVEKKIIKKQLSDHHNNLQCLRIKHLELSSNLLQLVPKFVFRILLRNISNSLRMSNIQQLQTKNKKIHKLKPKEQHIPYQVPIINLTDYMNTRE